MFKVTDGSEHGRTSAQMAVNGAGSGADSSRCRKTRCSSAMLGPRVLHRHLGWLRRAQGREQSFPLIQAGIKEYNCSTQFCDSCCSTP